jgi:hypothetical protein
MQIRECRAGLRRGADLDHPRRVWLLIALGVAIRLGLAFGTKGDVWDLDSYAVVKHALRVDLLHVYALVNTSHAYRWPYPPGFFPIIVLAGAAAKVSGLAFTSIIRLPAIAADAAIAWFIQDFLRSRGAGEGKRLAAAATVALGPLFVAVSGYVGEFDSVAILPAVIAVWLWDRIEPGERALLAGALIGLGGALKTVPLLLVFALLPSCRSRREGVVLVGTAAAIPAVALAPLLAADPHGVAQVINWRGLPGLGGLSLLAQPGLARIWLMNPAAHVHIGGLSDLLQGHLGQVILGVPVAFAAAQVWRRRFPAVDAATLLWLAVFVFSVNFGPRYAVWGLPFFLMGAHVGKAIALQAALAIPNIVQDLGPYSDPDAIYAYVPFMLAAWAASLAGIAVMTRRAVRHPNTGPPHRRLWPRRRLQSYAADGKV